jgi:hypothetical protein
VISITVSRRWAPLIEALKSSSRPSKDHQSLGGSPIARVVHSKKFEKSGKNPKNPKNPQKSEKSSKNPKIIKNPKNSKNPQKSEKSQKNPKILKEFQKNPTIFGGIY